MLSADDVRVLWQRQHERLIRIATKKSRFSREDIRIRQRVAALDSDAVSISAALVDYFWQAHQHYLGKGKALAYYPGHPSIYGARNDAIEGVARLLPLWAAYASSPYQDAAAARAMRQHLSLILRRGTDPAGEGYWGAINHKSTLICEGADIALAIWLSKGEVWDHLDLTDQRFIIDWLKQGLKKRTADNNWHLFVVLIDLVLTTLDATHQFNSFDRLQRIKSFYVSDGCFKDGENGKIDLYNAWGFHYLLFWINEINGNIDPGFAIDVNSKFCDWYQYIFTSTGLPLFGRSLCYRFAVSSPLLSCAMKAPDIISPDVALSAYLASWKYFVQEGGLQDGRPTQGITGEDIRWLDPYSGPASSFWGTRSIVMFYYVARHLNWHQIVPAKLPAEIASTTLEVGAMEAIIETDANLQEVRVRFTQSEKNLSDIIPENRTVRDILRQLVYATASRPVNNLQVQGLSQFGSSLEEYQ